MSNQTDKQVDRKIKTFLNRLHALQRDMYSYASLLEDEGNDLQQVFSNAGFELDIPQNILHHKSLSYE